MKAVTKLLKAAFKDRDLETDAKTLNFTKSALELTIAGAATITAKEAVAFGKLLGIDPRTLLEAQLDDQLVAEGVTKSKKPAVADAQPGQGSMYASEQSTRATSMKL